MKILTNECSVARALPATCPGLWVPISAPQSHSVLPHFPVAVQRAVLPGHTSEHDTGDRKSEEEPGTAEYGKLFLFSHILSNVTYLYSSQCSLKSFEPSAEWMVLFIAACGRA